MRVPLCIKQDKLGRAHGSSIGRKGSSVAIVFKNVAGILGDVNDGKIMACATIKFYYCNQ